MIEDELIEDELPSPPSGAAAEGFDDSFDASLLADVPKMGDALPVGTYDFRLEKFEESWKTKEYDKQGNERDLPQSDWQPYYKLQWKCQQEPHTGRMVFENCPWVRPQDVSDANTESPRKAEARKLINSRMPRAKEIMEAAGFTPTGSFGFKQFLATNPEMKLQLKLKASKIKKDGKLENSGGFVNEVVKHVSKHRPQ